MYFTLLQNILYNLEYLFSYFVGGGACEGQTCGNQFFPSTMLLRFIVILNINVKIFK